MFELKFVYPDSKLLVPKGDTDDEEFSEISLQSAISDVVGNVESFSISA